MKCIILLQWVNHKDNMLRILIMPWTKMEEFYFTTENKLNSAILYGPLQMYSYLHVSVLCHKTSKEKECFTGHNEHWGTAQGGHDAIPMCVLY